MSAALVWILALAGLLLLAILSPFIILIVVSALFGGISFGMAAYLIWISAGQQALDMAVAPVMAAGGLSAVFAVLSLAHMVMNWTWQRELPPLLIGLELMARHLFTFHVFAQIGIGLTVATLTVVVFEGDLGMSTLQLLMVSLFSIFVFFVAATYTSYFMRTLIPWRGEHPNFSNAVAYVLSIILGLIAALFAYVGKDTFSDASNIGSILYSASVSLGTLGATIVGSYIAIKNNSKR